MTVKALGFTIERAVKAYLHSEAVIEAFMQASASLDAKLINLPSLPKAVGVLKQDLALPSLIELNLAGEQQPASQERWQSFITGRLLSPGIHRLEEQVIYTPSLAYNQAFFTFHLSRVGNERVQREFVGYLRDFLLNQVAVSNKAEQGQDARLWLDTLNWLEAYSKQLKGKALTSEKFTLKHEVLAYKLLFEYECIPLVNRHDTVQQVAHIMVNVKGDKRTIERYLNSNVAARRKEDNRYFIYGEDDFEAALRYIKQLMPSVDTDSFRLDKVFKERTR